MTEANKNTQAGSTSLDRHILVSLEPTIKLDEIKIDSLNEEAGDRSQNSKQIGSFIPFVKINNIIIRDINIDSFTLDLSGFIPTVNISFLDADHTFSADALPRDGDVISVRIASRQDKTFKDIRADFLITSVFNSEKDPMSDPNIIRTFTMSGILKVPGLNIHESVGYPSANTDKHLKNIATTLKLGYASNIDATDDKMARLCPFESRLDFMKKLIKHAYVSDKSFQTGFIDPYYYLNFIDLNKVFNSKNEFEDSLIHVFNRGYTDATNSVPEIDSFKSQLLLSNHLNFGGSSQYISGYAISNNAGGISFSKGTKTILQYFENDSDEKLVSFDIEPIASEKMRDNEEPLKGRRGEHDWKHEVRQQYMGRMDVDPTHGNTHINYYTTSLINDINKAEIYKMGLNVTLSSPNHGLYRGMKIPILIFTREMQEGFAAKNTKDKLKNNNFKTLGEELIKEDISKEDPLADKQVLDEFVSGFYVIDTIRYEYTAGADEPFLQKLTLLRREWPTKVSALNKETMAKETVNTKTMTKSAK
jgi:hypothetical protein